jgi:hypothetical protein
MIEAIGDKQVAIAGHGHSVGESKSCLAASAVRAAEVARHSGEGRHDPASGDLANRVVGGIGDEHVASAIHRYSTGKIEPGRATSAVRDAGTSGRACQRRDIRASGDPGGPLTGSYRDSRQPSAFRASCAGARSGKLAGGVRAVI